jgi:hypothetical protein
MDADRQSSECGWLVMAGSGTYQVRVDAANSRATDFSAALRALAMAAILAAVAAIEAVYNLGIGIKGVVAARFESFAALLLFPPISPIAPIARIR